MFAYCPQITGPKCGVAGFSDEFDFTLKAGKDKLKVDAKELKYLMQGYHPAENKVVNSEDAEYDACHYEVVLDQSILSTHNVKKIFIKITAKSANVNAYIYSGPSRVEST